MLIRACIAKVHRATVTEADLKRVGSITVDEALLGQSGTQPFRDLNITGISNGALRQTDVMAGPRVRGDLRLYGPPARHFHGGHRIIVLAAGRFEPAERKDIDPVSVNVEDDANLRTQTLRPKRPAH